jgi:maltokinase
MAVADETHVVLDIPEGSSWTVNGEVASALEECILPVYLAKARWYPRKSAFEIKLNVIAIVPLFGGASDATSLAIVEADGRARYILPLMEDWSLDAKAKPEKNIVARLRSGEREGFLRDVAADPTFIRRLLDHLRRETSIAGSGWRLDFKPTSRLANVPARAPVRIRAIEGEQSNSTALVDQDYVIKLYRHIEPGQNPEF